MIRIFTLLMGFIILSSCTEAVVEVRPLYDHAKFSQLSPKAQEKAVYMVLESYFGNDYTPELVDSMRIYLYENNDTLFYYFSGVPKFKPEGIRNDGY